MPVALISSYDRCEVIGSTDRVLGRVGAVLFHPTEPRVVGFQVDRSDVLGVVARAPRFVALADTRTKSGALHLTAEKLPVDDASQDALGFHWDVTVIWQHMPVRSAGGDNVGTVQDAEFDRQSGELSRLVISTGVVGDVAVGRLEVTREFVRGFNGKAVIVLPGYREIEASGGAAKAAAVGVTAIKTRSGQVADGAMQVGVAAAGALGRSLKDGAARKAINKMKSWMGE